MNNDYACSSQRKRGYLMSRSLYLEFEQASGTQLAALIVKFGEQLLDGKPA